MPNAQNVACLWVPESRWPALKRRVSLTGNMMVDPEGHLLYTANLEPSRIGGIANAHPTVRVSAISLQDEGMNIEALVAVSHSNPASTYQRVVCMSTYTPTPKEVKRLQNQINVRNFPLLAAICSPSAINVPVGLGEGLDRFVATAYQKWPFMMLIHSGREPVFYATVRSLNHLAHRR